jgi:hypothetical protein
MTGIQEEFSNGQKKRTALKEGEIRFVMGGFFLLMAV